MTRNVTNTDAGVAEWYDGFNLEEWCATLYIVSAVHYIILYLLRHFATENKNNTI